MISPTPENEVQGIARVVQKQSIQGTRLQTLPLPQFITFDCRSRWVFLFAVVRMFVSQTRSLFAATKLLRQFTRTQAT